MSIPRQRAGAGAAVSRLRQSRSRRGRLLLPGPPGIARNHQHLQDRRSLGLQPRLLQAAAGHRTAPSAPSLGGGGLRVRQALRAPFALVIVGWRHKLRGHPVGISLPLALAACRMRRGRRRWSAHRPPTADHAFDAAACQHPAGCAAYCSHAASRSGASPELLRHRPALPPPAHPSGTPLLRHPPSAPPQAPALRPPGHATRTAAHTSTRSTSCGSRRDGPGGHIDRTRRRPRRRGR